MRTLCRSIALLATVAAPLTSSAQATPSPRQPDLIPRELVQALVSFSGGVGGGTDIRVGQAPDDIPPELVPPGAQIIGSMTQFGNTVLVLGVRDTPDSALGAMEAHLLAGGWTRPPAPPGRRMGGFVSADFSGSSFGMPNFLCHGDRVVNLSSMYRTSGGGGSLLKIAYNQGERASMCTNRSDMQALRSPFDDAPIPTLRAPAGSMMRSDGRGMSSSGSGVTVSTRLATPLKPGEVVAHYDSQMRAAGWSQVLEGAVEFLAARTYRKSDERNRVWTAVLYAMSVPDGSDKDIALHLSRR